MISYSWKECYWWISTFAVGPRAVNELETVADRWTFSPFQEQQIFSNEILKISRNCCPHTTCWHDPLEMNSSTLYLGRLNMNHCDHNDDVNPEGKSLATTLENISNITISMSAASTELSTKCRLASLSWETKNWAQDFCQESFSRHLSPAPNSKDPPTQPKSPNLALTWTPTLTKTLNILRSPLCEPLQGGSGVPLCSAHNRGDRHTVAVTHCNT